MVRSYQTHLLIPSDLRILSSSENGLGSGLPRNPYFVQGLQFGKMGALEILRLIAHARR